MSAGADVLKRASNVVEKARDVLRHTDGCAEVTSMAGVCTCGARAEYLDLDAALAELKEMRVVEGIYDKNTDGFWPAEYRQHVKGTPAALVTHTEEGK